MSSLKCFYMHKNQSEQREEIYFADGSLALDGEISKGEEALNTEKVKACKTTRRRLQQYEFTLNRKWSEWLFKRGGKKMQPLHQSNWAFFWLFWKLSGFGKVIQSFETQEVTVLQTCTWSIRHQLAESTCTRVLYKNKLHRWSFPHVVY